VVASSYSMPPGGNYGLAIRYPCARRHAYVGMCELRSRTTPPPVPTLDPGKPTGRPTGWPGGRKSGAISGVGEWNIQKSRVKGSKIKVRAQRDRDPRHRPLDDSTSTWQTVPIPARKRLGYVGSPATTDRSSSGTSRSNKKRGGGRSTEDERDSRDNHRDRRDHRGKKSI